MNDNYARAYTEVLEIISYFPKDEYNKIPKEEIEKLEENKDKDYFYKINPNIDLSEQIISKEANAILVNLFKDYFATEKQKEVLDNLLEQNQRKLEQEKREKYKTDNMFKQKETLNSENIKNNHYLVKYKESFFAKFKKWILSLIKNK